VALSAVSVRPFRGCQKGANSRHGIARNGALEPADQRGCAESVRETRTRAIPCPRRRPGLPMGASARTGERLALFRELSPRILLPRGRPTLPPAARVLPGSERGTRRDSSSGALGGETGRGARPPETGPRTRAGGALGSAFLKARRRFAVAIVSGAGRVRPARGVGPFAARCGIAGRPPRFLIVQPAPGRARGSAAWKSAAPKRLAKKSAAN